MPDFAKILETQCQTKSHTAHHRVKTTYRVTIHFSTTSSETMNDKIKQMLRNEIQRI
ncbi:transposon-encoded TnpW family protein [Caproicibacter fermentans]|uniref:Transposon-encoded TnpW family protein n=1 Tax=Caproicibacter fermentans TaxID=2576756 RepID=A0A7G8TGE4_9FIRM|nr:transposon-encoded TnpW family protein [Caproicibacter fermentans]